MKNFKEKMAKAVQKVNLAHLINEMEKQQEIAYELERVNEETIEENQRRELVNKAKLSCERLLHQHLDGFLINVPEAVYEDWIVHLHPDNVHMHDVDDQRIDHRFYVGK